MLRFYDTVVSPPLRHLKDRWMSAGANKAPATAFCRQVFG